MEKYPLTSEQQQMVSAFLDAAEEGDTYALEALHDYLVDVVGIPDIDATTYRNMTASKRQTAKLLQEWQHAVDSVSRLRTLLRSQVNINSTSVPVFVEPGSSPPRLEGEEPHWVFKAGRKGPPTRVRHPGAARRAGCKIRYVRDSRQIFVGTEWLNQNKDAVDLARRFLS